MAIYILFQAFNKGVASIPYISLVIKAVIVGAIVWVLKRFFGGARNTSERLMHSKVVMITGGTSGIGASVAHALALRGAQIILLTHHPASDPFIVEYILDLRTQTNNDLIYAEQVDLSSLHSIRLFATKWVDNAPPRRLDMVILCAATITPPFKKERDVTQDGVEVNWGVNYLANFHLLSILSPALRAQPPDRDVRVIMATCSSYVAGQLNLKDESFRDRGFLGGKAVAAYGTSKLALMTFAQSFQKHLDAYARPDKQPNNTRVILVDPAWTRTPGMRRFLSAGSLWGLAIYLSTWLTWWLVLKSPEMGAQSFLYAAMDGDLGQGVGGKLVRECKEVGFMRGEITDEAIGKELWELSDAQVERLEKEAAVVRAKLKKEAEKQAREEEKQAKKEGGKQAKEEQKQAKKEAKKDSEQTPIKASGVDEGSAAKASGSKRSRRAG